MKKNYFFFILLIVFGYSCQKELSEVQQLSQEIEFSRDKETIAAMGFDTTELTDEGDFYLVETDIGIPKDLLKDSVATRHYSAGSGYCFQLPANGEVLTVKIYSLTPDNSLKQRYRNAQGNYTAEKAWETVFKEAIQEWNSITDWGIKLEWTDMGGDIGIWALTSSSYFAAAMIRSGGTGGQIHLNVNIMPESVMISASKQKQAAVHLLGHAIGFYHTDPNTTPTGTNNDIGSSGSPQLIPGTHADANSVMLTNSILKEYVGFTLGDVDAARVLYPKQNYPEVTISGSTSPSYNSSASYTINTDAANQATSITWQTVLGAELVQGQGTQTATYRFSTLGAKTIRATVRYSNGTEKTGLLNVNVGNTITVSNDPVENTTTRFSIPASSSQINWTVSSNGEIRSGNGTESIEVYFKNSGNSTVTVTVDGYSSQKNVSVKPFVEGLAISPPTHILSGSSQSIGSVAYTNTSGVKYKWSSDYFIITPNGSTATLFPNPASVTKTGSYPITLTAYMDGFDKEYTVTENVVVFQLYSNNKVIKFRDGQSLSGCLPFQYYQVYFEEGLRIPSNLIDYSYTSGVYQTTGWLLYNDDKTIILGFEVFPTVYGQYHLIEVWPKYLDKSYGDSFHFDSYIGN